MDLKNHHMKRRKRASSIKAKHKYWLSLLRESQDIRRILCEAPLIELDQPYQRGLVRYYRLTDEAMLRHDVKSLQEALYYVQHVQCCRRGDFFVKKRRQSHSSQEGMS